MALALAIFGVVFALVCMIFNIKYWNVSMVKNSSPPINIVLIIGCIVLYGSMIMWSLDSGSVCAKAAVEKAKLANPASMKTTAGYEICPTGTSIYALRLWLGSVGFDLTFGSLFAKTYRIHKLWNNQKLKRFKIKNTQLYSVIFAVLAVDILYILIWQVTNPFRTVLTFERIAKSDPQEPTTKLLSFTESATGDNMGVWLGLFLLQKGLMLLYGAVLAYDVRDVDIKSMNDSAAIGISVYNVLLVCSIVTPVSFMIENNPSVTFLLVALGIFVCATGVLSVLFIPRMYYASKGLTQLPGGESGTTESRTARTAKTKDVSSKKKPFNRRSCSGAAKFHFPKFSCATGLRSAC